MKTIHDAKEHLRFVVNLAEQAGRIVASYARGSFQVTGKGTQKDTIDIVTDADHASEDFILGEIRKRFPEHDILTEETITEKKGSDWLWVVDPLDGTVNFSHGYPAFCVSIALMQNETIVLGAVYDPLRQETFSAIRGQGAFMNGNRIQVSTAETLSRSLVATGFPYDRAYSPINNVAEFNQIVTKVQGMRRGGSAALDLSYVACGRLDGFWELKLKPWDMAAGILLVEEAGGIITDRYGKPTSVYTNNIVASNSRIHPLLLELLAKSESA
ncbi:inositol monophosphatase family protein [Desulfomonile tiedjei]|uniref:Inositol-1-monophosphatase n=1 Tax=Desulfomonile tiedjei (strain ATCC 49306 / DSM 6799 / DCB-1) TaxID=706587 RepID=I4C363_DESTA|nr:inositol monophosphatase family protein [Desulfomonile tiedjei]AFM24004.1 inositol monophosphatase/fructose-1,6-bisphosphatase family protein [Desulfomonile tiedjei DSM 6799]